MKKKQIKKESNKTLTKIFIGFVLVFGSVFLIWWLNSTSYICSKNPDKCVEINRETGDISIQYGGETPIEKREIQVLCHYKKLLQSRDIWVSREMCNQIKGNVVMRKKTQAEIDTSKIECFHCIMLLCNLKNGGVINQGCFTNKSIAEDNYYNHFQYSYECVNTSIDYNFLEGKKLCYKDGVLIR